MDLAIYHPWLKEKAGAEKVVLEAAKRSKHDVTVFTFYYDEEKTFEEFKELDVRQLGPDFIGNGMLEKFLMITFGSMITKIPESYDKLIISTAGMAETMAYRNKMEKICYCHTPLRIALPEFKHVYIEEVRKPLCPLLKIGIPFYNFIEKHAWKRFDKIIANSQNTKERIIAKKLARAEKIDVVYPGAEIDGQEPGEYQKYFFYPSRFQHYKRQDLAIEAFKQAELEDFKLILAGSGQDQEYIEDLKQKAEGFDIEIKTDVPGKEWKKIYRNCYSVLFLAENEDWGIIPIEAASFGKPVIAANEGGPTESVIHEKTGYLLEPKPEKIAEKMSYLAQNKQKVEEIGKNAREESNKYSWEKFSEKIDELLKRR